MMGNRTDVGHYIALIGLSAQATATVGPADIELSPFSHAIFLPNLRGLWIYQEHYQYDMTTWERQTTWRDGWFFVADLQNDDYGHLVFDVRMGQVLKVTYAEPGWISQPLFRSLDLMALIFAVLVTPVADPQMDVPAIITQLREVLAEQELRTILTALRWQYTPQTM